MGISPIDMYGVRAYTIEDLLVAKTFQNSQSYISDYITSLSFPRDIRQYSICHLLEEDARRCYLTKCKERDFNIFQIFFKGKNINSFIIYNIIFIIYHLEKFHNNLMPV